MSEYGTRLRLARKAAKLTQGDVAKEVGKSRPLVTQWEKPDGEGSHPTIEDWVTMSRLYGRSIDYLMTGKDNLHLRGDNISGARTKQIPLIDYVSAGSWGNVVDPYEAGDGFEYVAADESVSDAAFALKVEGDSMSPDFKAGSIIIVDPNVRPNPGDMVIAKLDRDSLATFKKYRPRGADRDGNEVIDLVPLNPDWPTLVMDASNPGKIVGTVVSHLRKMR